MVAGLQSLTRTNQRVYDVRDFDAPIDGVTDARAAIQLACDAVPASGGTVYLPTGSYLVTGSIRPKSNTTICGDGYGTQIKCPSAGWSLGDGTTLGIINIDSKSNVRVTGLRITGTKSTDIGNTPKLIYLEGTITTPLENVKIDHCDLENTAFEGIWMGGSQTYTNRLIIESNFIKNVGYPAGAFVGLPAIQVNADYAVVSGNVLEDVGTGIGASGSRVSVVGNVIRGITSQGIATGDNANIGQIMIAGNVIEFSGISTGSARVGILIAGASTTEFTQLVEGNVIRLDGTGASGNAFGIYSSNAQHIDINENTVLIVQQGQGIRVLGTTAGTRAAIRGNTVRVVSESGASFAIVGLPNASGNTLTILSSDNRVYGITRAQGSFAYDYNTSGGGTLKAYVSNDFTEQGSTRIADVIYNNGELPVDNLLLSDSSDLTASPHYLRSPKIGMLNFQSARDFTISGGVIDISGSVANLYNRRTLIIVATEGGAGTDDLDTINGGQAGDVIILQTISDTRDVTVKNGTGNISCGSDVTLSTRADRVTLLYDSVLTKWVRIDPSSNVFADTVTFNKGIVLPTQTGTAQFGIDESAGTQLSIANDATATPFSNANNFSGLLMINDPEQTGTTGLFIIGGSSTVALVSQTGTLYSTTQGTAGKVNIYPNAGVITIENKQGATIGFRVFTIRMRNSG